MSDQLHDHQVLDRLSHLQESVDDIREKVAYLSGRTALIIGSNGDGGQFAKMQTMVAKHERLLSRVGGILWVCSGFTGLAIGLLTAALWAWRH